MGTDVANNIGPFIITLAMGIILVLVLFLPQRKKDKAMKKMLNEIKPGDNVRTIGGIIGTIDSVKDSIVILSVGPNKLLIPFQKGAIGTVLDSKDVTKEKELDDKKKNEKKK